MKVLLVPGKVRSSIAAVILLCFAGVFSEAQLHRNFFDAQYGPFNSSSYDHFSLMVSATINNGALQLTPDSSYNSMGLDTTIGRVLLRRKFKLWEDEVGPNSSKTTVASFNTSFLINIYPINMTGARGEGLAFVMVPNLNDPPRESSGRYLGLTNSMNNGSPDNRFIAIELDTRQQSYDPDDNHVGLNVNSILSQAYESLSPHGIELVSNNQTVRFYNIWVQYDGDKKGIEVYIAEQLAIGDPTPPMPKSPVLRSDLDLREWLDKYSYFGFSASNGDGVQLTSIPKWNLTVKYFPDKKSPALKIGLGTGIPAVVILVACVGAAMGCYLRRMRRRMKEYNSNIVEALRKLPGMAREYEFCDLKKATDNFDEKRKLGQGGYGVVYKGILERENLEVAVKWFSRESLKGEDDFLAELTIINRLRHKHLVRLLGWCHKSGKLLLVYEYMPNGSLDMHLFRGAPNETLSWDLRYKIVSGIASALHYLHNEFDQRVVHRDLKASNIMLDSDFNARLGDFGLARALDNEKTSYIEAEGVHGTLGYIAPECFHTGKATQQSDIYAFGTVLMELVCGRKPGTRVGGYYLLIDWVWYLYREGCLLDAVDEKLKDEFVAEEAERILLLGLACSHPIASERPKTQAIIQIITGLVPVPDVPLFKPSFVWPAMMPMRNSSQDFTTDTASLATSPLNGVEVFSTSYVRAKNNFRHTNFTKSYFTS